jgi:hypothetical protein
VAEGALPKANPDAAPRARSTRAGSVDDAIQCEIQLVEGPQSYDLTIKGPVRAAPPLRQHGG